MLEELKAVIKKVMPDIDVDKADENTRLIEDLHFDSLGMMLLAMSIENEMGVKFEEMVTFETVGDVLKYIETHR